MKITKMISKSKDKDCIDIYVDNELYASVSAEIVLSLHLKLNQELDLDTVDKIHEAEGIGACYGKALALLSTNMKTKRQLKTYLYSKKFTTDIIEKTIEKLENAKIIDDENYAKKYIESEKNKKGKLALKNSLLQRGIDKETVDKLLDNLENQSDTIKFLAEKYMKNKTNDLKNYQKLNRYLLSKGFTYSEIKECLGSMNDESWD